MFDTKTTDIKILDWDLENRPLSYWYDGNCTAQITAIAWSWTDEDDVSVRVLTHAEKSYDKMLDDFIKAYKQADMVTGHYIRKHDLPILNAALLEAQKPPLERKLTSDTKLDLIKIGSLSASQEALSGMYNLPEPKHHMAQHQWRDANKLTDSGIEQTKKRVMDDVIQHKALRKFLVDNNALKPPKMWNP